MIYTTHLIVATIVLASVSHSSHLLGAEERGQLSFQEESETEKIERKKEYIDASLCYTRLTGKRPDYTNLVETLRSPKTVANYKDTIDSRLPPESQLRKGLVPGSWDCTIVDRTLKVLLTSDRGYPEVTNEIIRIYRQSTDWRLRRRAAKVLERYKAKPDVRQFVRDLLARTDELKNVVYRTEAGMEMESVLDMISYLEQKEVDFKEVTNVLTRCYYANRDLSIQQLFRQAMERYDTTTAERFRREEMRHPDCPQESKLLLAKEFLAKGDPYGYPVLREGLMSQDPERYNLAASLLEGLRTFDGKPYDESGDRVNLGTVMREAAATNDLAVSAFREDHVKGMQINTNLPRAIELCRQRMNYSRALWLRIGYARVFLEESGWLFGYPVLKEGLLSRDEYTKSKAMELLESFRKHDGKPYDDDGHTINIQSLLNEVKKEASK